MPRLPVVSGRKVISALSKIGFVMVRQRGSHVTLYRQSDDRLTPVPLHDEQDGGTLKSILMDAGLTVQEFMNLL
ncbi:MAG: type II toxin-antitoxin system HicA family toxin [Candidatus Thermoplasmatota archaeon]|jgi:predicted RNA binding protein YcfA (HicA-like mRNA interferase family)|nr:type II toxin-antitoxin system HicA family toxin [Candidatus Thermoplasmatota archaeon]MCL5955120.1 type II toxin-antitoxin system HicA family toxin [Candidatus Thermoplasmatota archaeon]